MSGVQLIKITEKDDGMRLNRWFIREYPGLSLGRLQKLLRTKQIKLDGKKAEASSKLSVGQELRIPPLDNEKRAPADKKQMRPADVEFMRSLVIYKDDNLIAINKPSGLAVQGGTNTLRHVDGMLEALAFDKEEKPRLVHRIDKDTSGVLVLARNRKTADFLTKAFRMHNLSKTYLALVVGCPKKESGEIKAPLEKLGEKMVVSESGKPAVTQYQVLDSLSDKFALVAASPLTGRTHQIRAHLAHIGCPIAGDNKYFSGQRQKFANIKDILHLHAYKIEIPGLYNKALIIKAGLPETFRQDLENTGLSFKERN